MNQKLEGQIRHGAGAVGAVLVALGVTGEDQTAAVTDALIAAVGACMVLAAHIRSWVSK